MKPSAVASMCMFAVLALAGCGGGTTDPKLEASVAVTTPAPPTPEATSASAPDPTTTAAPPTPTTTAPPATTLRPTTTTTTTTAPPPPPTSPPTTRATPTTQAFVAATPPARAASTNCHPAYPDDCIPPAPPDLNCPDIARKVRVDHANGDPHGFDRDGDGWGCESYG